MDRQVRAVVAAGWTWRRPAEGQSHRNNLERGPVAPVSRGRDEVTAGCESPRRPVESAALSATIVAGGPTMARERSSPPPSSHHRSAGCTRRDLLRLAGAGAVGCVATRGAATGRSEPAAQPVEIGVGPQLFLDDYLIDRLEGLERRAESPERLRGPRPGQQDVRLHATLRVGDTRPREASIPALVQPRPGRLARRVRRRSALGEPAGRLGPTAELRGEPRR